MQSENRPILEGVFKYVTTLKTTNSTPDVRQRVLKQESGSEDAQPAEDGILGPAAVVLVFAVLVAAALSFFKRWRNSRSSGGKASKIF